MLCPVRHHEKLCSAYSNSDHAGNNFCGSVPQNMEGIVRNYTVAEDGAHFLLKVDSFQQPCPLAAHSRLSTGIKSGQHAILIESKANVCA